MTTTQQEIVDAIKNSSFYVYEFNGNKEITLQGLYGLLPTKSKDEIREAVANWSDVKIIGNPLDGIIEIPAKYFEP